MCARYGVNPRRSAFSSEWVAYPPHAYDLDWGPPWGIFVLLILFGPLGLLLLQLTCSRLTGQMACSTPDAASVGDGGRLWVFLSFPLPPPPSPPLPRPVAAPPSSSSLSPGPSGLGLLHKSRELGTMWAAPRRFEKKQGHDGPGLLLGRPLPPFWGRCARAVDHLYPLPLPAPLPSDD